MGDRGGALGLWREDLKERAHLEDRRVDGTMILQWIFKKWDEKAWTGLIWIRIGSGGGRLRVW